MKVVIVVGPVDGQIRSGPDAMGCRLTAKSLRPGCGEGPSVLSEIQNSLCVESELTWVHYAGTAEVEYRAGGLRSEGHPIFESPILMPDDVRPLPVSDLLDFAALSQAAEVLISLDVQVAQTGWLQLVQGLTETHLGPTATLIAVESQAWDLAFTRDVARLLAAEPGLTMEDSLVSIVASFAGQGALVIPPVGFDVAEI